MYDVSSIGGIPRSTPFQYLHYYHHVCLTHCNNYGLAKGEGEGCPTRCFFCQIVVSDKYNELYDYDWIMNGSITKSVVNKRNKSVVDFNSVARLPSTVIVKKGRGFDHPKFKENQFFSI